MITQETSIAVAVLSHREGPAARVEPAAQAARVEAQSVRRGDSPDQPEVTVRQVLIVSPAGLA